MLAEELDALLAEASEFINDEFCGWVTEPLVITLTLAPSIL
jgi:hypothetical protein